VKHPSFDLPGIQEISMAKITKKVAAQTFDVTPQKSVKIDGKLYVGGTAYPVTEGVLRKMQDADVAVIVNRGESTVRSLLAPEQQVGRPREKVTGGTDGEPYGEDEADTMSAENIDESEDGEEAEPSEEQPEDEEEEVEEEVEEPDPDEPTQTRRVKKKTKRAKRSRR
jgi:hypothetical protein